MIENTFGISKIEIKTNAKCFCPIGRDWYTSQFLIEFVPAKQIPDYCKVDSFIDEAINGKNLIVEEAVIVLYSYFKREYDPQYLKVTATVSDAKHSAVTVIKE